MARKEGHCNEPRAGETPGVPLVLIRVSMFSDADGLW